MSATMASIHQGTITDWALIRWIFMYHEVATRQHKNAAFDLFESRAERITMTRLTSGYVEPRKYLVPDRSVV